MEQGSASTSSHNDVSRETHERLTTFAELVLKWNDTVNLIGDADRDSIWERHILDSLQLRAFMPDKCQFAADLGSGGGFPGLVLAISTGIAFNLLESDKRKAAFLTHAAQLTRTVVKVHPCRIEDSGLRGMQAITSRALAPLKRLLGYAAPMLSETGTCLFLKGENVSAELADAANDWRMTIKRFPSAIRPGGEVLCIDRLVHV